MLNKRKKGKFNQNAISFENILTNLYQFQFIQALAAKTKSYASYSSTGLYNDIFQQCDHSSTKLTSANVPYLTLQLCVNAS